MTLTLSPSRNAPSRLASGGRANKARRLFTSAALFAAFVVATPAHADPWATKRAAVRWEAVYLALNVIDTAQTINCLNRDLCEEGNPLVGRNPSTFKLIAVKAALAGAHLIVFDHLNARNPKAALRWAQIGVATQGGVVLLNLRMGF